MRDQETRFRFFTLFHRGNCSTQYKRGVVIENVAVTAPGKVLAGINTNYGDTARFAKITSSATARRTSSSASATPATTPAPNQSKPAAARMASTAFTPRWISATASSLSERIY